MRRVSAQFGATRHHCTKCPPPPPSSPPRNDPKRPSIEAGSMRPARSCVFYSLFRLPPPETMPLLPLLRPTPFNASPTSLHRYPTIPPPYRPFRKGLSKTRRPRETPTSPIAPMRSPPPPRYWSNAAFKIFYTFIFWFVLLRRIQRVRSSRMPPSKYFSFSFFEFFG